MTKQLPSWDLRDFYSSTKDKKIAADLKIISDSTQKFVKKYLGKVTKLNAAQLALAITEYEIVSELIGKISSYSYLIYASDLSDQNNISFYQNISENLSKFEKELVFFTLEINLIEDKKIAPLFKQSAALKKYQPFIRDIRAFKKHQLSHELEKFSLEKNISSRAAFVRLFDETVNNLKFNYRKQVLNSQEIFNLMSSNNENVRKDAAKAIGRTLSDNSKTFAFITNILAKDKAIDDEWRGFVKPMQSRNLSNFVEDEVVDILIKKVRENYGQISHRYYKIKAKILGKNL